MEFNTEKLIDLHTVKDLTGISRSQIYNLMALKQFPQSISLSPGNTNRCSRWSFQEIQDWIEGKKAKRNTQ